MTLTESDEAGRSVFIGSQVSVRRQKPLLQKE